MTAQATMILKRLSLAAGAVLAFVLPLAGAELVLRWTDAVEPAPAWAQEHYARSLELLEACKIEHGNKNARKGEHASRRVIVVGESSAGMLADAMSRLGEACGVQVVDCAQGGSSLEHVERRFAQAIAQRPDEVLLLFGHNLPLVMPVEPVRVLTEYAASRSRLLHWLRGETAPPETYVSGEDRLAAFERFLHQAADTARQEGVRLTLATPIANPWYAPEPVAKGEEALVLRARYLAASGRRQEALARLEEADSAAALFERAALLEKDGQPEMVGALLRESLALSGMHTNRVTPEVLAVIRRVAGQEGVPLVDGERLSRAWYGPVMNWSHFVDACHPTPDVFRRYGQTALEHLSPSACEAPAADASLRPYVIGTLDGVLAIDPEDVTFRAWSRSMAVAVPHWLRAWPQVDELILEWLAQPSTRQAPASHRSRIMAALAHGLTRAELPQRASTVHAQAPAPEGPVVAGEWALWLISQGRTAEARAVLAPFAGQAPASSLTSWLDAP